MTAGLTLWLLLFSLLIGTVPRVGAADPSAASDEKYRLRPGDKVSFQIVQDRDDPKKLIITDSGELDIPYIGRVVAIEKTCKQLAGEIKAQLEKDYYYKATVALAVDAINRQASRLYVSGQVQKQGPVEIPAGAELTVSKAILIAGGFADFADKRKVRVVRRTAAGEEKTFVLDLVEILEKGKTEKDIILQADDLVIVPQRLVNF